MNDIILKNAVILSNICENMSIEEAYDVIDTTVKAFQVSE